MIWVACFLLLALAGWMDGWKFGRGVKKAYFTIPAPFFIVVFLLSSPLRIPLPSFWGLKEAIAK